MDRQTIVEHLELAERHVAVGIINVERQRRLVEKLSSEGRDTSQPKAILAQFEELLDQHIADRDRLLKDLRNSDSEKSA